MCSEANNGRESAKGSFERRNGGRVQTGSDTFTLASSERQTEHCEVAVCCLFLPMTQDKKASHAVGQEGREGLED